MGSASSGDRRERELDCCCYLPSEEEIKERAAAVRATWSEEERQKRLGVTSFPILII